jgi:hypothetical protein
MGRRQKRKRTEQQPSAQRKRRARKSRAERKALSCIERNARERSSHPILKGR